MVIKKNFYLVGVVVIVFVYVALLNMTGCSKEEPVNVTKADVVRIISHGRQRFQGAMFDMVGGNVSLTDQSKQKIVVIFRDLEDAPPDFLKEVKQQKVKTGAAYLMTPDEKFVYGHYRYIRDVDVRLTDGEMFKLFGL
jgi:hypothetical protein